MLVLFLLWPLLLEKDIYGGHSYWPLLANKRLSWQRRTMCIVIL